MSVQLQVIDFTNSNRKQVVPKLQQVIETVKSKQRSIYQFGIIVDLIAKQYQRQTMALQQAISALNDKESNLNAKVTQMETFREQLKQHQHETEMHLRQTQKYAAEQRQHKSFCEMQYDRVYGIPFLSKQSEKKYIKARDQMLAAEQQLSELRHELERCRQQVKKIVQSSAQQFNEKGQLHFQRRGSVDILNNKKMYLEHLQKGCEFWYDFDTYQAQVVLESAVYLLCQKNNKPSGPLDVDALWKKTFNLTCIEYNQRQDEGDKLWGQPEIQYDCEACQQTLLGWPHIQQGNRIVCDQCNSDPIICSGISNNHKMKRLVHALFKNNKTFPL